MTRKKRVKFAEVPKSKPFRTRRRRSSQVGKEWEFENYIKERLRASGIIQ